MHADIHILVVDDEEIMRNLFTDILREEDYAVTVVCHGKEAQEQVKDKFFDIALWMCICR